jgi:hypothetical protein
MPQRMPALFFGHGNPMNALLLNLYTEQWASLGAGHPKHPRQFFLCRRTGSCHGNQRSQKRSMILAGFHSSSSSSFASISALILLLS